MQLFIATVMCDLEDNKTRWVIFLWARLIRNAMASTFTVHQLSLLTNNQNYSKTKTKATSSWAIKSLTLSQCFNSNKVRLCCELMIRLAVVFQEVLHHGNHRGTSWYLRESATWSSNVKVWVANWLVWVNTMLEGQKKFSILAAVTKSPVYPKQ